MNRSLATGVFIAGIMLLLFGLKSSRSAVAQLSELFNNSPDWKTSLLLASGVACIAVGGWSLMKRNS